MATRDEIEEVRTRTDLVDVISRYVSLRPSGKNFVALCPFHPDKSPSMTVSAEKGFFHCFGCGESGDVFQFVQKIEKLEFGDALRRLAQEAGVTLTSDRESTGESERLRELAKRVAHYYQIFLQEPGGQKALQYLSSRGLTPEIIKKFQLGYAPTVGDHLLKRFPSSQEDLSKLGLLQESDQGKWSFFRGRVIFPLCSLQGEVVGFAGRIVDQGEPKYLNTKGTSLFEKGRLLYGIHLAREAFEREGFALLVEGYMDVIMAHQYGFSNAVASMGTAFTSDQARLLKRFVSRVLIAYDRDSAGQTATLRGLHQLLSAGLDVEVVLLPVGEDPDSLLRKAGAEGFREMLKKSISFCDFYVQRLFETHNARSVSGQDEMLLETRQFIDEISSLALRAQILKELSGSLMIPLEDLQLRMKGKMQRPERSAIMASNASEKLGWEVEEHLMYLLLHGEIGIDQIQQELIPSDFHRFARAAEILIKLSQEQGISRIEGVAGQRFLGEWLARLDGEEQNDLRKLAVSERRDDNSERAVAQLIGRLRLVSLDEQLTMLLQQIKEAEAQQNQPQVLVLQREQQEHLRERKRLLQELGWGTSIIKRGGRAS